MISFIVPAFNEEHELPASLESIRIAVEAAGQSFEIIVVDDASTDATAEIARRAGARLLPVNYRHIAAVRNAGAHAAKGEVLFFVDADTRIVAAHVTGAIAALKDGCAGGGARIDMHGPIPFWGHIFLRVFGAIYFALNFGAGAFLYTTRQNFLAIGGFDEQFFAGEEVFFTIAVKKLGRFKLLREPIVTSGRKLRLYSGRAVVGRLFSLMLRGPASVRSRAKLGIWYDGKRESPTI